MFWNSGQIVEVREPWNTCELGESGPRQQIPYSQKQLSVCVQA